VRVVVAAEGARASRLGDRRLVVMVGAVVLYLDGRGSVRRQALVRAGKGYGCGCDCSCPTAVRRPGSAMVVGFGAPGQGAAPGGGSHGPT
jgi:hypothetical protein